MKITDVRVRLVRDDSKLKGVASITIDNCFVVHDIKIVEGREDLFVSMPNKKTVDGGHIDIAHPINTETRNVIKDAVLDAYNKTVQAQENA